MTVLGEGIGELDARVGGIKVRFGVELGWGELGILEDPSFVDPGERAKFGMRNTSMGLER
jgi:hypothetical protein